MIHLDGIRRNIRRKKRRKKKKEIIKRRVKSQFQRRYTIVSVERHMEDERRSLRIIAGRSALSNDVNDLSIIPKERRVTSIVAFEMRLKTLRERGKRRRIEEVGGEETSGCAHSLELYMQDIISWRSSRYRRVMAALMACSV